MRTIGDAQAALAAIVAGTTSGAILADEAATLASIISSFVKTVELNELETRLGDLRPRIESMAKERDKALASLQQARQAADSEERRRRDVAARL